MAVVLLQTAVSAAVYYVDDSATGANNGSSWADAFVDLQRALDAAISGDEIRVGQGTYRPAGINGDPMASFTLIEGVVIRGGFAGAGAGQPDERNVMAYKSILSGDLNGDDVEAPLDFDDMQVVYTWANDPSHADNSQCVVKAEEVGESTVLEGFVIMAGRSALRIDSCSPVIRECAVRLCSEGGIYLSESRSLLEDCLIEHNIGYDYGGMYQSGGNPVLRDCVFRKNYDFERGGAIHASGDEAGGDSLTLERCKFDGNFSWEYGGAIIDYSVDLKIADCEFTNNASKYDSGSAIQIFSEDFEIRGCLFEANFGNGTISCDNYNIGIIEDCVFRGNRGGALLINYGADITVNGCSFIENQNDPDYWAGAAIDSNGNLKVNRCVFRQNSSKWGAVCAEEGAEVYVKNSLFVNNVAEEGGGLRFADSFGEIANCTFWGNLSANGSSIACNSYQQRDPSTVSIVNCILADVDVPVWNNDRSIIDISYSSVTGGWEGPGNIDADILFVDTENGDFHLKSQAGRWDASEKAWVQDAVTSPCIDAGDPATPIMFEPFPNGGVINMGAYGGTAEASKNWFGKPVCEVIVAGDINGDCKIDLGDFAILARHWLETN
jgi:hypothetical protein